MFAGIVAAVGRISSSMPHGDGLRIRIESGALPMDDVRVGDSIAVQGVCLTAVALDARGFEADVSRATLDVTHGLANASEVNLERSLRLGDRVDGHLVSGHVDGVGTVTEVEDLGGSAR
jgi:riboflavin synthase